VSFVWHISTEFKLQLPVGTLFYVAVVDSFSYVLLVNLRFIILTILKNQNALTSCKPNAIACNHGRASYPENRKEKLVSQKKKRKPYLYEKWIVSR